MNTKLGSIGNGRRRDGPLGAAVCAGERTQQLLDAAWRSALANEN